MIGLIILILVVIGLLIGMRALRLAFVWFDKVLIGIVILVPIILGLISGIWYAIGAFSVLSLVVFKFLGMGEGTVIRRGKYTWTLKCSACRYDDLEILDETADRVTTKCNRCGKVTHTTLCR